MPPDQDRDKFLFDHNHDGIDRRGYLNAWLGLEPRFRRGSTSSSLPTYLLPLELLTAATVVLTGHVEGFLSGVNGSG
jgi:hypothetical protein